MNTAMEVPRTVEKKEGITLEALVEKAKTVVMEKITILKQALEASEIARQKAIDELKKTNPKAAEQIEEAFINTMAGFDTQM